MTAPAPSFLLRGEAIEEAIQRLFPRKLQIELTDHQLRRVENMAKAIQVMGCVSPAGAR